MNLEHLKLGGPVYRSDENPTETEAPAEAEELTPEQKEAIAIIEETALMGRKPKPEPVVDPYEGDDEEDAEE